MRLPSVSLFTFGLLEQLFRELDHLTHLDPWEAFAHSKDDAVVEGVQQDAPAGIPQLIKLLPVQEPPQVLSPLGFLQGVLQGKETMSLLGMTLLWSHTKILRITRNVGTPKEESGLVSRQLFLPFLETCSFGSALVCQYTCVGVPPCVLVNICRCAPMCVGTCEGVLPFV